MALEDCKNGRHKLEEIASYPIDVSATDAYGVVRWCYECGSVVVDVDFDNRTQPGRLMKMKGPEYIKEKK